MPMVLYPLVVGDGHPLMARRLLTYSLIATAGKRRDNLIQDIQQMGGINKTFQGRRSSSAGLVSPPVVCGVESEFQGVSGRPVGSRAWFKIFTKSTSRLGSQGKPYHHL